MPVHTYARFYQYMIQLANPEIVGEDDGVDDAFLVNPGSANLLIGIEV